MIFGRLLLLRLLMVLLLVLMVLLLLWKPEHVWNLFYLNIFFRWNTKYLCREHSEILLNYSKFFSLTNAAFHCIKNSICLTLLCTFFNLHFGLSIYVFPNNICRDEDPRYFSSDSAQIKKK